MIILDQTAGVPVQPVQEVLGSHHHTTCGLPQLEVAKLRSKLRLLLAGGRRVNGVNELGRFLGQCASQVKGEVMGTTLLLQINRSYKNAYKTCVEHLPVYISNSLVVFKQSKTDRSQSFTSLNIEANSIYQANPPRL